MFAQRFCIGIVVCCFLNAVSSVAVHAQPPEAEEVNGSTSLDRNSLSKAVGSYRGEFSAKIGLRGNAKADVSLLPGGHSMAVKLVMTSGFPSEAWLIFDGPEDSVTIYSQFARDTSVTAKVERTPSGTLVYEVPIEFSPSLKALGVDAGHIEWDFSDDGKIKSIAEYSGKPGDADRRENWRYELQYQQPSNAEQVADTPANSDTTASLHEKLIGTWAYAGKPDSLDDPKPDATIKFFGPKHFVIVRADSETGELLNCHGGTYTLKGDVYTGTILYGSERRKILVGQTIKLAMQIDEDVLIQKGIGNNFDERWIRQRHETGPLSD